MGSLNILSERFKFFSMNWKKGLPLMVFYSILKDASSCCHFLEPDNLIRDMIILKHRNKRMQKLLLEQSSLTLEQMLQFIEDIETKKAQVKLENDIQNEEIELFKEELEIDVKSEMEITIKEEELIINDLYPVNNNSKIDNITFLDFDLNAAMPDSPQPPQNIDDDDMSYIRVPLIEKQQSTDLYECTLCCTTTKKSTFVTNRQLRNHLRKKHNFYRWKKSNGNIACPVCSQSFNTKISLKQHLITHEGVFAYKCQKCDQSYRDEDLLKRHQTTHLDDRKCTCDICGKTYKNNYNLRAHIKASHSTKNHLLDNEIKKEVISGDEVIDDNVKKCKKKNRGSGAINSHLCDLCGKDFKARKNFLTHLKVHSGVRPYKCKKCDRSFRSSSNLRGHERTHSGERPFKCNYCDKTFIHLSYIKVHQRIHTGERPYTCDFCSRGFMDHKSFRNHRRLHTGECPYKCQDCDKAFPQLTGLKSHQRIHLHPIQRVRNGLVKPID